MNDSKTQNMTSTNTNTNNDAAIFNLIQNIQSKLNNELDNSNEQSEIKQNNENKVKNIDNNNNNKNNGFDISNILSILSNSSNENSNNNENEENSSFFDSIDPNLFFKLQKIIVSLGKKDPKKDLLISLKPFLRKSRQDKIGEYITILTVIKAFEAFNDKGSD